MNRHDITGDGGWRYSDSYPIDEAQWLACRFPMLSAFSFDRVGRGAHRAAPLSFSPGEPIYNVFGLRLNETTGNVHRSRLVGK